MARNRWPLGTRFHAHQGGDPRQARRCLARARTIVYAAAAMRQRTCVPLLNTVLVLLLGGLFVGCAPKLGDSCKTSTDCSVQGDRQCDISQPSGYCTIMGCVAGTCAGEGFCVRFEPDEIRLSSSWCMAKCQRGSSCRDGYRCVSVDELNDERQDGERVAEMLDNKGSARFCVPEG
jgi:hypothetical protein